MPISDYQEFMKPMLELLSDRQERLIGDITHSLADKFGLSESERQQMLDSGQQTVVSNRVAWTKTYLKKAGLVENPLRGRVRITDEGLKVLTANPSVIDRKFLMSYGSFADFLRPADPGVVEPVSETGVRTPEEAIGRAYNDLRKALADDLVERVKSASPQFFEQLVVKLLVAMGYGGSLADAGQAIGRSGDGGIDGMIKEDPLGLDGLCIQAKRWEAVVSRPVVQAFAGSMEGVRARKGVLITTSGFSKEAIEYVRMIERKIVLIDGQRLAGLMIDHGVGVTTTQTYAIKKADSDFFSEE